MAVRFLNRSLVFSDGGPGMWDLAYQWWTTLDEPDPLGLQAPSSNIYGGVQFFAKKDMGPVAVVGPVIQTIPIPP